MNKSEILKLIEDGYRPEVVSWEDFIDSFEGYKLEAFICA